MLNDPVFLCLLSWFVAIGTMWVVVIIARAIRNL